MDWLTEPIKFNALVLVINNMFVILVFKIWEGVISEYSTRRSKKCAR